MSARFSPFFIAVTARQITERHLIAGGDYLVAEFLWARSTAPSEPKRKPICQEYPSICADVFSGYRLDIEFSFHLRQFFEGVGEEESKARTVLIKTA